MHDSLPPLLRHHIILARSTHTLDALGVRCAICARLALRVPRATRSQLTLHAAYYVSQLLNTLHNTRRSRHTYSTQPQFTAQQLPAAYP
ncbi:hypothetical protein KJY78_03440 [Canibacter sp. lx-45]|uniref:hypothetical protein n=1 Tax=Canibacter zhuwentaonis TaxID=2837491 RepID=UPI001BDC7BDA|nr:hypothetical protein [Canibacter zhuwentaonis]MBT1035403.1 hypothetical protein [Canibacter zhuwentaonis]